MTTPAPRYPREAPVFFTSDLHFGHDREFIWKERGYESIHQMNNTQLARFNEIVGPNDIVYILGDVTLGPIEDSLEYLYQLNGEIHIIRGNHDTDARVEVYKTLGWTVEWADVIHWDKYHLYLSHFPTLTANLEAETLRQGTLNLFGHTHQKDNFYNDIPMMYHVGVDSHAGYPISAEQIIKEMNAKAKECIDYL
jgi:calcineurin-like phosphoesterase family protein